MTRATNKRQHSKQIQWFRKKHLRLTTLALCMLPSLGFSLGLGDIRSSTHLGDRLKAEINLVNLPAHIEASSLIIRQVRSDEAEALGVDIVANWQQIDFSFNPQLNDYQIQLHSRNPVREPFLNILIEVVWPDGKLYREYTLFLDPAPVSKTQTATASKPASTAQRSDSQAEVNVEGLYTVAAGDTLSAIARRLESANTGSDHDWEEWLYQHNRNAFIDGNRHRLIAGVQLRVPQTHDSRQPAVTATGTAVAALAPAEQSQALSPDKARINALLTENRNLRERLAKLDSADYLLALKSTLEKQNALVQQLRTAIAANRAQHDQVRPLQHTAEARPAPLSQQAGLPTSALLANSLQLPPETASGVFTAKFWAMTFTGGAVALLLIFSTTQRLRSSRPARLRAFLASHQNANRNASVPLNQYSNKHSREEQAPEEANPYSESHNHTENEIDEMLMDLDLEPSVKKRLRQELAAPAKSLSMQDAPEKEARDKLVQNHIQEKIEQYKPTEKGKNDTIVEEIPIDPEMEAYLKL